MEMTWSIGAWIIMGLFAIGALIIARELFCWYWKINEIKGLLEKILDRLPDKKDTKKEEYASVIKQNAQNEPVRMQKIEPE